MAALKHYKFVLQLHYVKIMIQSLEIFEILLIYFSKTRLYTIIILDRGRGTLTLAIQYCKTDFQKYKIISKTDFGYNFKLSVNAFEKTVIK